MLRPGRNTSASAALLREILAILDARIARIVGRRFARVELRERLCVSRVFVAMALLCGRYMRTAFGRALAMLDEFLTAGDVDARELFIMIVLTAAHANVLFLATFRRDQDQMLQR